MILTQEQPNILTKRMAEYAEQRTIPQIVEQGTGHLEQLVSEAEDFASSAHCRKQEEL